MKVYNESTAVHHLPEKSGYWRQWERHVRTASKQVKTETGVDSDLVEVDFSRFTPKDYLLSHATIVAGVQPEPEYGYIITPHGKWVNDNGNAWFNQVILETYTSFLMAYNFQEHIQIPEMAKGFVIDAVAWIARNNFKGVRESVPTVFVDILVATNKKRHPDLVYDILNKNISTLSMGTEITHFQCSQCLKIFKEDDDNTCEHLQQGLGSWFVGKDGKKHRTAEMCGVPGHPKTNQYNEVSWVGVPAFENAERHMGLVVGETVVGRPIKARIPRRRWKEASKHLERW